MAVDIPTGISGNSGQILGQALRADYTATMAFLKTGLCLYPGREYAGEVMVIDIGLPPSIINKQSYDYFTLSASEANNLLPERAVNGHKGTFGKVLVVGGAPGMSGAPYLSGMLL